MIFNEIPANVRVPGQYAEFDISNAASGLSTLNYETLIIGQGTDAGSKSANEVVSVTNADQAGEYFGFGSQVHLAAKKYYENNTLNPLTIIAATMDPLATATSKATGSIQITGAATADGAMILYVAGQRITVAITSGDTVNDIAAAIAAEIAANHPNLPVKTTVATDTVSFEAKNLGVAGNDIDIRTNYYANEVDADGVAYTITAMSGGTADPALTSVIAAMADTWWQLIISPYTETANWNELREELDRRFGPTIKIDGVAFTAKSGTQSNLVTFGSGKNTKQVSCIGVYDVMEQPVEVASAAVGQIAGSLSAGAGSESRPFQTLELKGIHAPREANRFTFLERDALLKNGISTIKADAAGVVRIERMITTWQTNSTGAADVTWLDVNTRFTAMFIRWDWVTMLATKYPRAKLASDATRVGPGQQLMTPAIAKAEALARFSLWEEAALVEDLEFFKANLLAVRDGSDVNAMNWFLPCDFVNQFRVGKTQIGVVL